MNVDDGHLSPAEVYFVIAKVVLQTVVDHPQCRHIIIFAENCYVYVAIGQLQAKS